MRYEIFDGSISAHCCFTHTVVDTTKPDMIGSEQYVGTDGRPHFESICECYSEEDATTVRDALNDAYEGSLNAQMARLREAWHEFVTCVLRATFGVRRP